MGNETKEIITAARSFHEKLRFVTKPHHLQTNSHYEFHVTKK
jgi:hypothetical protein